MLGNEETLQKIPKEKVSKSLIFFCNICLLTQIQTGYLFNLFKFEPVDLK